MKNSVAVFDSEHGLLIDGNWRGTAQTFAVRDPATGRDIGRVADAGPDEVVAAIDAAARAQRGWASTSARQRAEVLMSAFELIRRDTDRLAELIALENGKSIGDARAEIAYAAEFLRWYAEEAVRTGGRFGPSPAGGTRTVVTERPVGVAALITPWNFPAAMITRKVAPALAAGCTVVLKPASETPLTAIALTRLLVEAGVPAGVVNLITSSRSSMVADTWLQDARVRKLSFTGSTRVGAILLAAAAGRVVNCSMELGGNAPFVVTGDADVPAAVAGAMVAKFRNGGQACTAANAFYVHQSVLEQFTDGLAAAVRGLRVGAACTGADIGPMITEKAATQLGALVDGAVERGARVVAQAAVDVTEGYFYPPTVLAYVSPQDPILAEELFGPVAPVVAWSHDDELLGLVNRSEMGLASYIYSRDLQHALRLAEAFDTGMVGINRGLVSDPSAPFGGMKQSGLGREGAREGLEEFLETQYFSINWS